jgi:hypothetical protein
VFVGFTETLALDTPVMPAETATVTMTYNGTGGMIGFVFDSDATTITWRFVAGDAAVALATAAGKGATVAAGTVGGAIGIAANVTITADRWYIFRVEVDNDGMGRGFIVGLNNSDVLTLVGESTAALGTGDNFHATALIENRSAANEIMEVDYCFGEAYRDWSAD